ncbi:PelD GGDEF domain-containing protein [Chitinimonas sp. BJYL2]|uniref:PelD GGDEF domain-containing protein n=1 Tax=Chitinimonas sp. BJYL2 TaxID=2976696 RepID=UPI0022B5AD25|nr:PelD GGDEF domain-containing protein [Chitinimonas sp. BJYL2]
MRHRLLRRLRLLLGQLIAPGEALPTRWLVVETTVLTAAMLCLSYLINPQDPLALRGDFPWPWFAPLLLALRYGVLPGLGGAAIMMAAWWLAYDHGPGPVQDFPKLYFLGGLIATMIAGEYAGAWQLRLRRVQESNAYLYQRLRRVSNQYYLMRLSHDRLEHEFLLKPTTMRDALSSLKAQIDSQTRLTGRLVGGFSSAQADAMLNLLSQFCGVDEAGCYRVPGDDLRPVAYQGSLPGLDGQPIRHPLVADDPMVLAALENRVLTHVQTEILDRQQPSAYQVVVPIMTADDRMLGLIAVRRIGFFSLHEETLLMLAAMVAYFADSLVAPSSLQAIQAELPDCPADFAEEVGRLLHLSQIGRVESWLVLQVFRHTPQAADAAEGIRRLRRGLDSVWLMHGPDWHAVLTLLPMTNAAGVEGYVERIGSWANELYGPNFSLHHSTVHTEVLTGRNPVLVMKRALAPLQEVAG